MFGGNKRRATKTAVEAVMPILRTLEMSGGVPPGFWADAYALGYLWGTIGMFAKLSTHGKIAGEDLGVVLMDTFQEVSGRDGLELGKLTNKFVSDEDRDFLQGAQNAQKVVCVVYGIGEFDQDPDVIEAKQSAKKMGSSLEFLGPTTAEAQISAMLSHKLFYQVIRDRLDSD